MITQVVSVVLFIAGVVACYQGALHGAPWFGPTVVLALLVLALITTRRKVDVLKLALVVGVVGFALESTLIALGVYSAAETTRWVLPAPLCPMWLLALWVNFAVKMPSSLALVRGRPIAVAVTGAVLAVLIFASARRVGVVVFGRPVLGIGVIALLWAAITPALFCLAGRWFPTPVPSANIASDDAAHTNTSHSTKGAA
jgi:hypothetical protein